MKVRLDFVTNSSTSSCICEVCGDLRAGMDLCLSDTCMIECEKEHIVCETHVDTDAWGEDEPEEYPYEVPAKFCPICTLKHVRDGDILDYVLLTEKDVVAKRIREQFVSLEALREWCDEDKK